MSWDESDRILQMERTIARCEDAWLEPPDAYADEQEYSDEELMEVQMQVYLNKYAEATKAEAEAFGTKDYEAKADEVDRIYDEMGVLRDILRGNSTWKEGLQHWHDWCDSVRDALGYSLKWADFEREGY